MSTLPPRVIHLAPRSGESGVGDYADDFVAALRRHVDVVELRFGPPGADRLSDIVALRRELRRVLRTSPPGTVVHAELSGGATPAFWAIWRLPARRTATLHDAPRPVWFPLLTRGVQRLRVVGPVLVRLLSPLWLRLERAAMRDVGVVTLSDAGAQRARDLRIGADPRTSRLIPPTRPEILPPWERPPAVGLFGHVYRGKGFDLLARLRQQIPDDIAIRVAGRGTQRLRPVPGVEILGPVEGPEEDAYFASIRVLLLAYRRAPIGGVAQLAASAAHLQGAAYETPAVAVRWPTMDELAAEGGCLLADDPDDLARVATALVRDEQALRDAHRQVVAYRDTLTADRVLGPYLDLWAAP